MNVLFAVVMSLYILFLSHHSWRQRHQLRGVRDFFFFDETHDADHLIRSFQASSVSFTAVFLGILAYTAVLGSSAYWLGIGFGAGVIFYAAVLLPRQKKYLLQGKRFPRLLQELTGRAWVRPAMAIMTILIYALAILAETHGVRFVLGPAFLRDSLLREALPALLAVVVMLYSVYGGFRLQISTDHHQLYLIVLGCGALVVGVLLFGAEGGGKSVSLFQPSDFFSRWGFIAQTLLGLAFTQLLLYDNWLRLSLFFDSDRYRGTAEETEDIFNRVQRLHYVSGVFLILILAMPVLIGMRLQASGIDPGDKTALSLFFAHLWSLPAPLGQILTGLGLLGFFAALFSTMDTCLVALTVTCMEDLLKLDISGAEGGGSLAAARWISLAFAALILAVSHMDMDFLALLLFVTYGLNGLAGPLLLVLIGVEHLPVLWLAASVLGAFAIPALILTWPAMSGLRDHIGIINLGLSLLLVTVGLFLHRLGESGGRAGGR